MSKVKNARKPTADKASRNTQLSSEVEVGSVAAEIALRRPAVPAKPKKVLSLGVEPNGPQGESCNIRDVLDASDQAQNDEFAAMGAVISAQDAGPDLRAAADTLRRLLEQFGDDER